MFEYVDVTNDPAVERRAGLSSDLVEKVHALGFTDIGWIATIAKPSDEQQLDLGAATTATLITRVMLSSDAETVLALTRAKTDAPSRQHGEATIALKTLFHDGHIVSTEERAPGIAGRLVSRALTVPRRHHYDLATFPTSDVAELVALHKARVDHEYERVAAEASSSQTSVQAPEGTNPEEKTAPTRSTMIIPGDLEVYVAMRGRYRAIATPRFEAQQTFATRVSWLVFFLFSGLGVAGIVLFGVRGSSAAFAGLIGLMFAALCGASTFPVALVLLAPLFVRDAEAPAPPSRGMDLVLGVEKIRMGRVPRDSIHPGPDSDEAAETSERGSSETTSDAASVQAVRALPADVLTRLRRLDTLVSIGNSLILPIAGFALMPVLGSVGPTAALGSVASIDAAILFIMQRSRVDLLRGRFIPKLVEAEGPNAAIAPSWLRWISLAIGVLALVAARRAIAKGIEPAERWLLAEWGFLTGLFVYAAWRSIRRRHARFNSSSSS